MSGFVNRERELRSLEESYGSDSAALYVLYGRRRVGKTELLRAFCGEKRHIFFVADLGTESHALAELTRRISDLVHGRPDALGPFPSWDLALQYVGDLARDEPLVLVIDEFTYLISANPGLPSIIQRVWDTSLRTTRLKLILCGSYVGMMEQHVLSYRSPLYGRRTAQWQLRPFTFPDAVKLLGGPTTDDQVRAYGVLGGVPAYLVQFDPTLSILDNVERKILTTGGFLYAEPRFLLLQELGEPHRYFAVLEAIAAGRTRVNEIAQSAGLAVTSIPFYLSTLRELGLVSREVPATERQPHKSKRGVHRLLDHFFRFWFRFVYPNHSLLERGETTAVRSQVEGQIDQFIGPAFEEICREHVWRLHRTGQLPFVPRSVGSWWDDQEEIDVVAISDEEVLLGECKWSSQPIGTNILDDLKRKAERAGRKQSWKRVSFVLFSRSGFTPALEEQAADEPVRLIGLDALAAATP